MSDEQRPSWLARKRRLLVLLALLAATVSLAHFTRRLMLLRQHAGSASLPRGEMLTLLFQVDYAHADVDEMEIEVHCRADHAWHPPAGVHEPSVKSTLTPYPDGLGATYASARGGAVGQYADCARGTHCKHVFLGTCRVQAWSGPPVPVNWLLKARVRGVERGDLQLRMVEPVALRTAP